MKKDLIDEHLMHIVKNTTPLQRLVWLKKQMVFWKKMETKRLSSRPKPRKKCRDLISAFLISAFLKACYVIYITGQRWTYDNSGKTPFFLLEKKERKGV